MHFEPSQGMFEHSSSPPFNNPDNSIALPTRHSTRQHKFPSYLQDFQCYSFHHDHNSTSHALYSVLSYDRLSSSHRALICSISSHKEPKNF